MKTNTIYTALEILTIAGIEKPEEKIGKMRVRIGGIPVNKPDHLVYVSPGSEALIIIVGIESFDVSLESGPEEKEISTGAREKLDKDGVEETKKAEKLAEEKKSAEEKE